MGIKWTEYRVGRRWSFSQSLSFVEPRAHDNVNLSFRCVSKLEAVVSISILTGIDQDPLLGGNPTFWNQFFHHGNTQAEAAILGDGAAVLVLSHRKAGQSRVPVSCSYGALERIPVGKWLLLWLGSISSIEGWDPPFLWKEEVVPFLVKGKGLKKRRGFFKIHVPELYLCTSLT